MLDKCNPYGSVKFLSPDHQSTQSNREIEYDIISLITKELRASALRRRQDFPRFVVALGRNRDLWEALASSVNSIECTNNDGFQRNIIELSRYVRKVTSEAMIREKSIDSLIEINISILRGLNDRGGLS